MQSSTAIAIRTLIMLIVLISVPLFAIFGKNLPDVAKGLLEGRGLVLGPAPGNVAPPATNSPIAAPLPTTNNPFGQAGPDPYRASTELNSSSTMGAASTSASAPMPIGGNLPLMAPANTATARSAPNASNVGSSAASANSSIVNPFAGPVGHVNSLNENDWRSPPTASQIAQPAGFQAPVGAAPLLPQTPPAVGNQLTASQMSPQTEPYATSISSGAKAVSSGGNSTDPAPLAATGDEKFRQAEMRLRELGATHYMLETWGPDNNRYRFVCKMAIGGNAGVNRYFQAIENDPWQAMTEVLHQVEQWRAQPQP